MLSSIRNIALKLQNLSIQSQVKNFQVLGSTYSSSAYTPYEIVDENAKKRECEEIFSNVNNQIKSNQQGRLFAIIHVTGRQFKVTTNDAIILQGQWPPSVGDKIRFDKLLMVGSADFTLIGRPLLAPGLVNVHGTVIEKTLTHTKIFYRYERRRQRIRKTKLYQFPLTMVRINSIDIVGNVNCPPSVTTFAERI